MSKQKINVWGREFELDIVYDCYTGEEVLATQTDALANFLTKPELVNQSKSAVEKYCIERNADEVGSSVIDNIFKYVMPESLYVQRTKDGRHVVGLMCNYKYDIEHGIAVVFENEQLKYVDSQDSIL
ncbi:hypothetical protein FACS189483_11110 [Spirochaetia bacterium]|nr:hypothetical protein FACS189483_11110 [Spirochaetia bacterium]